jgi:penicillin-binding protein 2
MLRIRIISSVVIVVFLVLLLYLFNFQVISGAKFRDLGNKNCIRLLPAQGSRGRILDRKGKVIVDNQLCYDAMIMSGPKEGIEKALTRLSGILNKDIGELKRTFSKSFIGSFAPTMVAENISIKQSKGIATALLTQYQA